MENTVNILSYPWLIGGLVILIIIMLALDLWVFNKKKHAISNKEALITSIVWISLAMGFSLIVWKILGFESFAQFQAAYWIEKSLSVDNLFVFILVFSFFKIPDKYQHEVLFYGVIGAIIFRAIFIFAWVGIINLTNFRISFGTGHFNSILFIFGIFLIIAGYKSLFANKSHENDEDMEKNIGYKIVKKFFQITPKLDNWNFFTIQNGVKMATPLFVALVVIEITDLVFAIDSIPAIFSIAPNNPFILYTSNIFAILGLRSLYFLLANSLGIFSKLHYGVALVLMFIGIKMLSMPIYHFHIGISLSVIAVLLFGSMIWSVISNQKSLK